MVKIHQSNYLSLFVLAYMAIYFLSSPYPMFTAIVLLINYALGSKPAIEISKKDKMIYIWILYAVHTLTILLLHRKITGSSEEWVNDNYPDGDGSMQIVNSYDYYLEPIISNRFIFIALLTSAIPIIITLSYKKIIFFCRYNDEWEEMCE